MDHSFLQISYQNSSYVETKKIVGKSKNSSLIVCMYVIVSNTAPPSQKGGNNTRCISCKRAVLYINLIQAPHCSPIPYQSNIKEKNLFLT